jgi:hypothetical protein
MVAGDLSSIYSNRPHYINFLGELPKHFCTDTLRLEHFDGYFLTTICASVPEEVK